MKLVYRIQKNEYAQSRNAILSSIGASINGGRWNQKGISLIYTSATPELAALENQVHLVGIPYDKIPPLVLITLQIPDSILEVKIDKLPPNWNNLTISQETQEFTKIWLKKNEFLAMQIPSVVMQKSSNLLLNPNHRLMDEVNIIDIETFKFDPRLFIDPKPLLLNNVIMDILGFESQ